MTKIEPAAIAATPDDSPSMLSRRLNAFVIPTTHTTVIDRVGDAGTEQVDASADSHSSEAGADLDHESDHWAQTR